MKKAVLKRIKFTKNGKLMRKSSGQNHFNAKESRKGQMRKNKMTRLAPALEKSIRRYL